MRDKRRGLKPPRTRSAELPLTPSWYLRSGWDSPSLELLIGLVVDAYAHWVGANGVLLRLKCSLSFAEGDDSDF